MSTPPPGAPFGASSMPQVPVSPPPTASFGGPSPTAQPGSPPTAAFPPQGFPTAQPGPAGPPPPGWVGQQPGWQGGPPDGGPGGPAAPGQQSGQQPGGFSQQPLKVAKVAQILCPVLVIAGLSIPSSGSMGWTSYPLWAIFAAVMSLVQLITLAADRDPNQSSTIRVIATGALVAYWVVIVLPGISSNSAFIQTLGVGCAVVAAWLAGSRR